MEGNGDAVKLKKNKAEGSAEKTGGGRNNLVPAVVLAVGLVGGGFLFGGRTAAPAQADTAEAEAEAEVHAEAGPVVPIDPITLNLADGHFLKVGIALQMAVPEEGGGGHGEEEVLPEGETAKALDAVIELLGRRTMEELSDPAARTEVKAALTERLAEAYHGEVTGVYLTEFVMQ